MNTNMDKNYFESMLQYCRKAVLYVAFFSLFVNLFMLTVPLYMLQVFDRVFASFNYSTLLFLSMIAFLTLLVMGVLDAVRNWIFIQVSKWLDQKISPEALRRVADMTLTGGTVGTKALTDLVTIRNFITSPGVFSIFDLPWVPIYLALLFVLHVYIGLIATCGAIILLSIAMLNNYFTQDLFTEAREYQSLAQNQITASIRNVEVIQSMGMMSNVIDKWAALNGPGIDRQTQASERNAVFTALSKFLRLLLQISVLGVGAALVINNQITPGVMIAGAIIMSRALAPIDQAIGVWKSFVNSYRSYQSLKAYFSAQPRAKTDIELPEPKGEVMLDGVSYVVPFIKKPILFNLGFKILPGNLVAVIGPTGAGKTTLARLIVGAIQATQGEARLDGADIFSWDRDKVGKHIGYLPQDIELFAGTVKENIARMGKVDDEKVVTAAKISGVHEMILHLPLGYDTPILQTQLSLSGGQKQRIALARAIYDNPKLIVLDEPNSSLDKGGEQALVHTLLSMKKQGATQIVITHKTNLLEICDKILLLHDGTVKAYGPGNEVIEYLRQTMSKQQQNVDRGHQQ